MGMVKNVYKILDIKPEGILDSYQENLVALGGESCSSS
jgi:hypothetical protein